MKRAFFLVIPALVTAAFGACSDPTSTETPSPTPDASATVDGSARTALPCDVDAILDKSCRRCHGASPQFGAPMSLVTWEDVQAAARSDASKKVFQRMKDRVHDDASPMPPAPNPRLGAQDLATLDAWIDKGAPAGGVACSVDSGTGGTTDASLPPLNCTPDLDMKPPSAWEMPQQAEDEYVCFGVDVPVNAKRHIIGIQPRIDNTTIVHHVLLMQSDRSEPKTPTPCSPIQTNWRVLYGWAPGGQGFELPPEAGLPLESTSHFVVQLHYSNLGKLSGQKDTSGFSLCTTDKLRANDADVMAFGTTSINVPARGSQDVTCDLTVPSQFPTIHTMAAFPHMHLAGKHISTKLLPKAGGGPVDLGTVESFQFNNQLWYPAPATIKPGDTVRTRCAWTNPGTTSIGFGEKTSNEMCFSFTMYYPKITSPSFSWMSPSVQSQCSPTR